MKKVAIMTWYHYKNFGTALQVTALSRIVEKMGYQPEVIQYIPHGKLITRGIYQNPITLGRAVVRRLNAQNVIRDEKRDAAFSRFIEKHIKLTRRCSSASELYALNGEFDAFICGSDQIWAPTVFDPKYFLDFVQDSGRMVAYAPSIGVSVIEDAYVRTRMKDLIRRFEHLSVREMQGANIIKELCGKDATVALDPTLMLDPDEWNSMASDQAEPDSYILAYFLGNNKLPWRCVKILSDRTDLPVKVVPVFKKDLQRGYHVVSGVGPAEFLGLVRDAALVCTDSFHCTAFSMLYGRPFFAFERFSRKDVHSQNSRIYNILGTVGLMDRLSRTEAEARNKPLGWNVAKTKRYLEIEKQRSYRYLENALRESTEPARVVPDGQYAITNTCCGCGVCTVVCKQDAISVSRDKNGFLRASVIQGRCTGCGMCTKVCPFNGQPSKEIDRERGKLYMAYSTRLDVLRASSSGGVGYELSRFLCERGYDVIGCTYDQEKGEATHQRVLAGEVDKLNVFQGSKYLQSTTEHAMKELVGNRCVFLGTPCQVVGVDRLLRLRGQRDNAVLVDLICRGVPSQNIWDKYIEEGSQIYGYGSTPEVSFRYKPRGWRTRYIRIHGNGKTYMRSHKRDLFYRFFLSCHCFAESCYECNYRTRSAADIRIGDYWGPRFRRNKNGVSMIIAMTSDGEEILQQLHRMHRIELQQMSCEEYWTVQFPVNPIRPVFYEELMGELRDPSIPLRVIANKYCKEHELFNRMYSMYSLLKRAHDATKSIALGK